MKRYVIERDIPDIGSADRDALRGAAKKSNSVLAELAPDIQWIESYVAGDKTFCVYMAKDEGDHPRTCAPQWIPCDDDYRDPQDDRPDDRARITDIYLRARGVRDVSLRSPSRSYTTLIGSPIFTTSRA